MDGEGPLRHKVEIIDGIDWLLLNTSCLKKAIHIQAASDCKVLLVAEESRDTQVSYRKKN